MKRLLIISAITIAMIMGAISYFNRPVFGKQPSGERLERIHKSPNYRDGAFQNQSHTPDLTDGANYFSVLWEFIFGKSKRATPSGTIPSTKIDLLTLPPEKNILVWFGHSSYFMQIDGVRILVDPVFSGTASPFSFATKAFKGTDRYTPADMPEIDLLFITHDHYDHLDYKTIAALRPKVKKVISGLGTGAHLEHWGYERSIIHENDWGDSLTLENDFAIHAVPARHFSGRLFKRNQTLWASFVLITPGLRIFIGGDSGYDTHFAEIGRQFGPFDLAMIENGQYNKSWKHIHLMPDEFLRAANELNAKGILPVHSSKFVLGNHAWDEPLELVTENNKTAGMKLVTPIIGEVVNLGDTAQQFTEWWKEVK